MRALLHPINWVRLQLWQRFQRPAQEHDEVHAVINDATAKREDALRRIRALDAEARSRGAR